MLRRSSRRSIAGCSKGARGLFVLIWEIGILTDTAVSPSLRRRQPSSRYAIHAGRNLPDKEFRYLRTVIVTAAVYRGFGTQLRLAYLCRIAVRSPQHLRCGAFLGSRLVNPLTRPCGLFGIGSRLSRSFIPRKSLPPYIGTTTRRRITRSCVPPHHQTVLQWYRNVDLFPIGYAFRPHLRDRLTLS